MSVWGRAAEFESRAAMEGVDDGDIHVSRLSGMSPQDIEHLRIFTVNEALLVVIRCPKRAARYLHGLYQPKTMATGIRYPELKSGADGLVVLPDGRRQVSDYDLMCVYRLAGAGRYEKIFFSGIEPANKRSPLTPEAAALLRKVNADLKSRFQHRAQDDFDAPSNPGVSHGGDRSPPSRFAAFNLGTVTYLATPRIAQDYYRKFGLAWPYDAETGRFAGSG